MQEEMQSEEAAVVDFESDEDSSVEALIIAESDAGPSNVVQSTSLDIRV